MTSPSRSPPSRALAALWHRFISGPLGAGKPVPPEALDHEYRSGAWNHFFGPDELPRHLCLLELIRSRPPRPTLLDLGCGSGRLASLLRPDELSDYLGVDLSSEGLAKARALGLPHGRFAQGNYETWRPDRPYDIITFNECLGYARHPARTAAAFAAHLNPGGCLMVSHFRWGNHAALWKSLERHFRFDSPRSVSNDRGQTWDLKILLPRP